MHDPELLNAFFAPIAERTLKSHADSISSILQLIDNFPEPESPPLFKLRTVSPGRVVQVLKSLRSDSSTSPDQIPVKFLKMVGEIIAGPIT